jgi:hypothetical protein
MKFFKRSCKSEEAKWRHSPSPLLPLSERKNFIVHATGSENDLLATTISGKPVRYADLPRHTFLQWACAFRWSLRMLRHFEKGQSQRAYAALPTYHMLQPYAPTLSSELHLLKAAYDVQLLRAFLRLVGKPHVCFAESFALCVGLKALGFDAHIMVGYARMETYVENEMHAWVEVAGELVSDLQDIPYLYQVLYRDGSAVPRERGLLS